MCFCLGKIRPHIFISEASFVDAAGATDGALVQALAKPPAETPNADNPYSGTARPAVALQRSRRVRWSTCHFTAPCLKLTCGDQWLGSIDSCGLESGRGVATPWLPPRQRHSAFLPEKEMHTYCRVSRQGSARGVTRRFFTSRLSKLVEHSFGAVYFLPIRGFVFYLLRGFIGRSDLGATLFPAPEHISR